jgi:nucleoside-diphosphate-sugar epimerase
MSTAAITGASGYVGSAIARAFRAHGWRVVELGRKTGNFELGKDITVDWAGVDALVHCAWDFKLRRWDEIERVNLQGSVKLMESACAAGVKRGVFISSLSCFPGCRSFYGKAKLAAESEAARLGFAIIRPGLVYGDHPGGMAGTLEKAVLASPVVPLIGDGSAPQYPVHEQDLAELVFTLCAMDSPNIKPNVPISAASGEAIPFREFLARLAARHSRKPLFIPIPWRLILAGLKSMEALGLNPPFRSDSLVGFIFQNPNPDFTVAHQLTSFRKFQ